MLLCLRAKWTDINEVHYYLDNWNVHQKAIEIKAIYYKSGKVTRRFWFSWKLQKHRRQVKRELFSVDATKEKCPIKDVFFCEASKVMLFLRISVVKNTVFMSSLYNANNDVWVEATLKRLSRHHLPVSSILSRFSTAVGKRKSLY